MEMLIGICIGGAVVTVVAIAIFSYLSRGSSYRDHICIRCNKHFIWEGRFGQLPPPCPGCGLTYVESTCDES